MTFTLTFAWWWIPAAVTLIGAIWVVFSDTRDDTFGIGFVFRLTVMFFFSAIAWAIGGSLK